MAPKRKASSSPPLAPPKAKANGVKAESKAPEVKKEVKAEAEESPSLSQWRFDPLAKLPKGANWPAPAHDMDQATTFLQRLLPSNAKASPSSSKEAAITLSREHPLVLLPDKDADGLCSTLVLHRTLLHLGVEPEHIHVHHLSKANHAASTSETDAIKQLHPAAVILLDQGSRPGPPLLGEGDTTPVLVIDHHFLKPGETGPRDSLMLNASHSFPVATSSLLTWCLCRPLWTDTAKAETEIDWLSVMGTAGDLSVNVAWDAPWPDLSGEMKRWTKKRIGTGIALLNAPRRTPEFDVGIAYASLQAATTPIELLDPAQNKHAARLYSAREAVAREAERCTHTPPKFSKDGRVAVMFISSPYQVHPGIATRWSGALRGAKKLQVVMAANSGYSPHDTHTHFSCRRAQVALKRGETVDIIAMLHEYAARDPTFLADVVKTEAELEKQGKGEAKKLESDTAGVTAPSKDVSERNEGTESATAADGDGDGDAEIQALNFARGHREASGGILPHALFQRFCDLMEIGVPPDKSAGPHEEHRSPNGKKKGASSGPEQKTKLTSFFGAKGAAAGGGEKKAIKQEAASSS